MCVCVYVSWTDKGRNGTYSRESQETTQPPDTTVACHQHGHDDRAEEQRWRKGDGKGERMMISRRIEFAIGKNSFDQTENKIKSS